MAMIGGLITGYVLKAVPGQLKPGSLFVDDSEWEVPAPASHDTVRDWSAFQIV